MPPTPQPSDTLLQSYMPVFAMVSALEVKQDYGETAALQGRTEQLLTGVRERLRRQEVSDDYISDAQYAVVAFIDEAILRSNWHGKNAWQVQPLGIRLALQPNPGVTFFDKLESWLRSPEPPIALLHVFHLCLGLGFRGQYFDQPAALQEVKRRVLDRLLRGEDESDQLSPSAERPKDEMVTIADPDFPWMWLLIACGGLLIVLFIILRLMSNFQIDSLMDVLRGAS